MAKMEDTVREHRDKVEAAEAQLSSAHEEHKHNLDNLRSQLQNSESSELNQVGILLEKHRTEIEEKEHELTKVHEKCRGLEDTSKELEERLDYNLESSNNLGLLFEVIHNTHILQKHLGHLEYRYQCTLQLLPAHPLGLPV